MHFLSNLHTQELAKYSYANCGINSVDVTRGQLNYLSVCLTTGLLIATSVTMATSVRDTEIGEVDETLLEYELIVFIEQERRVLIAKEWLLKRTRIAVASSLCAVVVLLLLFLGITYSPLINIIGILLFGILLLTAIATLLIALGFDYAYAKELAQVTKRNNLLQVWSRERKARMKADHRARIMMEMLESNRSPESGNPDANVLATTETNTNS